MLFPIIKLTNSGLIPKLFLPHLPFHPRQVSPSGGLYLAAGFKVSSDLFIVQDAKDVVYGDGSVGLFDDVIGVQVKHCACGTARISASTTAQRLWEIFFNHGLFQALLVAEKALPRAAGRGVGVLLHAFVPVLHIGVVDADLDAHLG